MMCKNALAEGIGTFWLVLAGCGAIAFGGDIGTLGIALAFGLSILTMGYVIGPISGCHLNPAVTIGLVVGNRFEAKDAIGYVIAQVIGALAASWLIGYIGMGHEGHGLGAAANGFDMHSAGGFSQHAVLVTEIVMTAVFLFVFMGISDGGHKPLAIGFAMTVIYLITIVIDNGGINPARATGPAILLQGDALDQLWLFWVAPVIGAVIGAICFRKLSECN